MKNSRTTLIAIAAGVAGVVVGITGIAQAANSGSTTTTSPKSVPDTPGAPAPGDGRGHRGQWGRAGTEVTGADADKAKAAALAAVPGTVERVVKLPDGTYVVHVVKADKSSVHVRLDASFKVTGQDAVPGPRGPRGEGHGRRGWGAPPGTEVTGADADKAKAAALAAVPGTVERVVKLPDGTYVVHVVKADKSSVHVRLDASFKVTGQDAVPGPGGATGGWGHQGRDDHGKDGNDDNGGSPSQTSNAAMGV